MKLRALVSTGVAVLLLAIGSVSFAENQINLVSRTQKEVTVVKDGKKEVKLVPAQNVVPGDVVLFTNHYQNSGKIPAENAVISNPVPKHMVYLDGSAFGEGAEITFSIDKGKTFDTPGKLVKTEKGKKRTARAEEYTHIRWTFKNPIPPGKEGDVGFRARLK
ncbi:hypothetical protein LPW11_06705 [Geomonas sp. RF6]|uniref:hypothetical protein n=1 Tax=Geomonas sp. RF6 TaxID=2897342 RepID=UPI001E649A97|nr:hypothetical protein [Geomonas sp. RF6]UFS71878.1 hypothetical protein LPW11_06705 [Geomonas sp. RF6]